MREQYKVVPMEPTPEMVSAAEEAHMPFGDMDMAIRMALLAAPAVQGEAIGFCEDTALSLAERTFSSEVDEQLAEDVIQYARRLHDLYTAPQPAEQQPEPISRNLRAVHAMILNALDRDAANGEAVRGEMATELRSALLEHQPAPDVTALVDALVACRNELLWMIERHNQQDQNDGSWLYDHQTVAEADAALAAHRKQGGGQ